MALSERFLKALGAARAAPSVAYLRELLDRHLDAVPYENVSKVVRFAAGKSSLPTAEEYLDGLERHRLGGTCFAVNAHFGSLLRELGFEVELVGGPSLDGANEHLALRVRVDGKAFAVDLGFMSPDPGPFDLAGPSRDIAFARQIYRFFPTGDGLNWRFQVTRDGNVGREFRSETRPRQLSDFDDAIARSFGRERLFMTKLCISRRFGDHFKVLWGREFALVRGVWAERRTAVDREDLEAIVRQELALPDYPLDAALQWLT